MDERNGRGLHALVAALIALAIGCSGEPAAPADAGWDAALSEVCEPSMRRCPGDQYCSRGTSFCSGPGTCRPYSLDCSAEPDAPVCGCDGTTYRNSCEAFRARTSLRSETACP